MQFFFHNIHFPQNYFEVPSTYVKGLEQRSAQSYYHHLLNESQVLKNDLNLKTSCHGVVISSLMFVVYLVVSGSKRWRNVPTTKTGTKMRGSSSLKIELALGFDQLMGML